MTKEIKLPALPQANGTVGAEYFNEDMQSYASAAVELNLALRGEVVVTKNQAGQIVAVTRQDEDGKILSVIAESSEEDMGAARLLAKFSAKNIDPNALVLLAELLGVGPCEKCGFVKKHCKCADSGGRNTV